MECALADAVDGCWSIDCEEEVALCELCINAIVQEWRGQRSGKSMTPETLKIFGPSPTHRLWHDQERKCDLCVFEAAAKEPLPADFLQNSAKGSTEAPDLTSSRIQTEVPLPPPPKPVSTPPAKPKGPQIFVLGGR